MSDEIELLTMRLRHIEDVCCFVTGFVAAGGFSCDSNTIHSDHIDTLNECWHLLVEKRATLKKDKTE